MTSLSGKAQRLSKLDSSFMLVVLVTDTYQDHAGTEGTDWCGANPVTVRRLAKRRAAWRLRPRWSTETVGSLPLTNKLGNAKQPDLEFGTRHRVAGSHYYIASV